MDIEVSDAYEERRRDAARALGFLTAKELAELAGVKMSTVDAWRRRRIGPRHVRLGNQPLYPLTEVRAFLLREASMDEPEANLKPSSRRHILDAF